MYMSSKKWSIPDLGSDTYEIHNKWVRIERKMRDKNRADFDRIAGIAAVRSESDLNRRNGVTDAFNCDL